MSKIWGILTIGIISSLFIFGYYQMGIKINIKDKGLLIENWSKDIELGIDYIKNEDKIRIWLYNGKKGVWITPKNININIGNSSKDKITTIKKGRKETVGEIIGISFYKWLHTKDFKKLLKKIT